MVFGCCRSSEIGRNGCDLHETNKKATVALIVAVILVAGVVFVLFNLWQMRDNATNFRVDHNKHPNVSLEGIDWNYWLGVNPDLVGWVVVDGTNINYPVVKAKKNDPEFYLTHDIYGNWNVYGVPYLDADCTEGLESRACVIYGHNMDDGSVFADFAKYSDKGYASEHREITILTPDGNKDLETKLVRVVEGDAKVKVTDFKSDAEFSSYYADQKKQSNVILDQKVQKKTVLFVSCSYNFSSDERTVVFAS